jgi:hypothetical protein
MRSLIHLGFVGALVLASSCSDSGSDDPAKTPDPTEIGADGGTVTQGNASVEIPEGALSEPIKIAVAASDVNVAPPDGYVLAGPPFAFTPHGTRFDAPVTLTLPYTSSSAALAVLRLDDEDDTSWEVVDGGTFAKGSATLDVTSFSIYAVAEESAEPAGMGGAGGMSTSGDAGSTPVENAGAPAAGGAPSVGVGDLTWSCDRMDTDGNGLRICSDYFYPAMIVKLIGDLMPSCPGAGDGVLGEACDTSDAVGGCFSQDVDGIAGVTVTNWFYMGTADEIKNGILCTADNTTFVDPP